LSIDNIGLGVIEQALGQTVFYTLQGEIRDQLYQVADLIRQCFRHA
jgi:hypothetical protein